MTDFKEISVIVVAAGSGSRFGSEVPKQFCDLSGRPVVVWAIKRFLSALPGAEVVVVVSPGELPRWEAVAAEHGLGHVKVALGADTRWGSVGSGLAAVSPDAAVVLVHDGARPLVDEATIHRVVDAATIADGAIPAVEVVDSLRKVSADGCSAPVDRAAFRAVQTPQGFPASKLRRAYGLPFSPLFTDDASVMAAAGFDKILLVNGSVKNIKITNPLDIKIAELQMRDHNE